MNNALLLQAANKDGSDTSNSTSSNSNIPGNISSEIGDLVIKDGKLKILWHKTSAGLIETKHPTAESINYKIIDTYKIHNFSIANEKLKGEANDE